MPPLRLIAGLGNPGPQYRHTRHNVGADFVEALARRYAVPLTHESKFKGLVGRGTIAGHDVRLLVPVTYVNLSGDAVGAVARFYRIAPEEILVAYDEMAFEPGVLRLKSGGGDNGHNGIRSVISGLGNQRGFQRLRIGVGHPGDRSRVTAYLTSVRMPEPERERLARAFELPEPLLRHLLGGDLQKAMTELHSRDLAGDD
ncbi:MAG: aminoacyl-tRNA hydrolase [Pseudomonadota bacterium]